MERKTYRTQKTAKANADGKEVYFIKGPPLGWRIRKNEHNQRRPKISSKDETFGSKILKVNSLIEDYWRTKGVRDDIVRQKSLAKIETNWQWVINILNEEMTSLENKIADLLK